MERTYVRFRGCFPYALVLAGVVLAAVVALAFLRPEIVKHYARWVRDRMASVFFPPVKELEREFEPRIYLPSSTARYCGRDHAESLASLRALFESERRIPSDESRKNVFANLVRLSRHGVDYCSGLQVTTDGFVLTAHHCIEHYERAWIVYMRGKPLGEGMPELMAELRDVRVVGTYREVGPLDESFLATYPEYDIAMIKAEVVRREHEPVRFNLETRDPHVGEPITLIAFNSGKIYIYDGRVITPTLGGAYIDNEGLRELKPRVMQEGFFTDVYCEGGFSGGVVLDRWGGVLGLHSWGVDLGFDTLASGHAKARHVETLIRRAYDELTKQDTSLCSPRDWEGY